MIVDADERLRTWLADVVDGAAVEPAPPEDDATTTRVTAMLLGFEPTPSVSTGSRRPATVVVRLRYLVWVDAPEPAEALDALDALVAATIGLEELDGARVRAELVAPDASTWLALGVRPRPAITVLIDVEHTPAERPATYVRHPLRVIAAPVRSISGELLGPDDEPLVGAEVTLLSTGAVDRTSRHGTFTFPLAPSGEEPLGLSIRTAGRFFTTQIDPTDGAPLVVHCDPLEG